MAYEAVKARINELQTSVGQEVDDWEALLGRGKTIGETAKTAFQELQNAQAINLERTQKLAVAAQELLKRIADTDGVLANADETMMAWIAEVRGRLETMSVELETRLVPALGFARDIVDERMETLRTEIDGATEALATALIERLGEARETVIENLSAAVEAVETAFAALIEGLSSALNEARSTVEAAWQEAKEASEAARQEMSEKGQAIVAALEDVIAGAVERVTGKLTAVAEDIERIIETFETTFGTLQRTLDLARTLSEGASVGMGAAARGLDTVRNVITAVA